MRMPKVPNFIVVFEKFSRTQEIIFGLLSKLFLKMPKILGTLDTQLTCNNLWCLRLSGLPNFVPDL